MNGKTFAILGGFSAYAIVSYIYYEDIIRTIATSGFLVGISIYFLLNPAYLLVIYGIFKKYSDRQLWKRVIASLITILSLDFLAFPRLSIDTPLIDGGGITSNIGSIMLRLLEQSIPHSVAYPLLYLVLPIVGLAISVELLGITNFIREVHK